MSIVQRAVLLLKVLVMLTIGLSATVRADCPAHDKQASSGHVADGGLMLAKSEAEPGDQDQGGSKDDDDSITDEPDTDDDDDDDTSST